MRFIGQVKGKEEEQGQNRLPSFDKGMRKYQKSILKEMCDFL